MGHVRKNLSPMEPDDETYNPNLNCTSPTMTLLKLAALPNLLKKPSQSLAPQWSCVPGSHGRLAVHHNFANIDMCVWQLTVLEVCSAWNVSAFKFPSLFAVFRRRRLRHSSMHRQQPYIKTSRKGFQQIIICHDCWPTWKISVMTKECGVS
jgi:hypothetical protein